MSRKPRPFHPFSDHFRSPPKTSLAHPQSPIHSASKFFPPSFHLCPFVFFKKFQLYPIALWPILFLAAIIRAIPLHYLLLKVFNSCGNCCGKLFVLPAQGGFLMCFADLMASLSNGFYVCFSSSVLCITGVYFLPFRIFPSCFPGPF